MKVFLSWSGERSRAVAELLSDWIRCVLQATRPWISTRDLDRGSVWFGEINDQLKDTKIGIVCLTQENKVRPWILFEAGALAKGLASSRILTFLIDLQPKDVEDPLAQFNHTLPSKESMKGLVEAINAQLGADALDQRVLPTVFQTYWPQFESAFADILKNLKPTEPSTPRKDTDILGEILENTRILNARVSRLESGTPAAVPTSTSDSHREFLHRAIEEECRNIQATMTSASLRVSPRRRRQAILDMLRANKDLVTLAGSQKTLVEEALEILNSKFFLLD